jgi:uncharacterized protein (TIGR03435 family)
VFAEDLARTGLNKTFDIHLELCAGVPDKPARAPGVARALSPHASDIEVIRDQRGLQLSSGRETGDLLVIDHIGKADEN